MLGKVFALFALLGVIGLSNTTPLPPEYSTDFVVENGTLMSVSEHARTSYTQFRIYSNSGIVAVDANAFDGCNVESIMISDAVRNFYPVLNEGTIVNLTKEKSAYHFDLPDNVTINEYACDEGFTNYWDLYIRNNVDKSICNVSREHYTKIKALYSNLSEQDKLTVKNLEDGTGTIEDSLEYLDSHFNSSPSKMTTKEISQSVMITVILVIASFGMTAIGIFYVLKDKKVIN